MVFNILVEFGNLTFSNLRLGKGSPGGSVKGSHSSSSVVMSGASNSMDQSVTSEASTRVSSPVLDLNASSGNSRFCT